MVSLNYQKGNEKLKCRYIRHQKYAYTRMLWNKRLNKIMKRVYISLQSAWDISYEFVFAFKRL